MSITKSGLAFVARFRLKPDCIQQFLEAHRRINEHAAAFMQEHAHFVFYGWGREPDEWVAIEAWKDEGMLNRLRADPDFQEGVRQLLACCAHPVEVSLYAGMSGTRSGMDLYPPGRSQVHPPYGDMYVKFL